MAKLAKTERRSAVRGISKMSFIEAIRMALATGLRRGEIVGLEWGSVDFEARTIKVVQSRSNDNVNKTPKTKAGIRAVHIDEKTLDHLWKWKMEQAAYLLSIGIEQGIDTPVCCNDKGGYLDKSNFERFWRSFKSEYGFEGWKFHELRHTQATQLISLGVDIKTVQTRIGHASASTTLNFYAHAVPENDIKASELVGSLLSGGKANQSEMRDLFPDECVPNVSWEDKSA